LTAATTAIDVRAEVAGITATLEARRDPAYEAGMRRTVPSLLPAHATRVPDVRKTASEWRRAHRDIALGDLLAIADALWRTEWREERLVAIALINSDKAAQVVGWQRVEAWSAGIDNWEHVDHLADVTGRMLRVSPVLLTDVLKLETSANPWQRRLALVTLIVAFRADAGLRDELAAMAERLRKDPHALVRRAVVWARDRLAKDHLDD
jgi:3-methyladenine DNA glycosylase AlkD